MRPIRKKKGSTANEPGAVTCATVADPSRIVLITTRTRISQATLRRSSVSNMAYVNLLIKSKIGMYIAMTMPPTTTPRTAIMIGSSSVSRPATAVSTSSS